MRVAAQVLFAYLLILLIGVVWHLMASVTAPVIQLDRATPDIVALIAIYLGLTARPRLAPAVLGAVIVGYLGDLLLATPPGAQALAAGVICLLGHLIHRRLIVRGLIRSIILGAFAGVIAGLIGMLIRAYGGHLPGALGEQLGVLARAALITGLMGPLVFRLCRLLDSRFARTHREREAAREGLTL